MLRFRDGDASAFEALYDRHAAELFGLCLNLMGERADAEDALQETFLRLIALRRRFQPRGQFRNWILTIGRRVCLDRLRWLKRKRRMLVIQQPQQPSAPHEEAISAELDITRLLAALSEGQREVLVLSRLEGRSYAEIAEMTGSSEDAVKQKAYRAFKALQAIVSTEESAQ